MGLVHPTAGNLSTTGGRSTCCSVFEPRVEFGFGFKISCQMCDLSRDDLKTVLQPLRYLARHNVRPQDKRSSMKTEDDELLCATAPEMFRQAL